MEQGHQRRWRWKKVSKEGGGGGSGEKLGVDGARSTEKVEVEEGLFFHNREF
jgi:hypothetical protein